MHCGEEVSKFAARLARPVVRGCILSATAYAVACGTGDNRADPLDFREPPADPVGRFSQLEDLRDAANFTALYSLDTRSGFDEEQFKWAQLDLEKRWGQVGRDGAKLGGTTVVLSASRPPLTCIWVVRKEQHDGDAVCSPSESDILHNLLEGFSIPSNVRFAGYKRVSSLVSECFETSTSNPVVSGHICMTEGGIPTEIEATVSRGGFEHRLMVQIETLGPAPSHMMIS
jgi:hypothetical protein